MKIFYLLMVIYSSFLFSLGNQKSDDLEKKINLIVSFDGKTYEFFSLGGKTDGMFYGKDPFAAQLDLTKNKIMLLDNPDFFQIHLSFIPHPMQNSVKSIQYIPIEKEKTDVVQKSSLVEKYHYGHREWHKVKIIFTNGEERQFLVSSDTKISLYDPLLSASIQLDVSCLKTPLVIEEIKCFSPKKAINI
jgi:hypothetical protein